MAIQFSHHAGSCCGVFNMWNFGPQPTVQAVAEIDRMIAIHQTPNAASGNGNRLIEVCLIDGQLTTADTLGRTWADILRSRGFKRMARFRNSNSGNIVNVFHLFQEEMDTEVPYRWPAMPEDQRYRYRQARRQRRA